MSSNLKDIFQKESVQTIATSIAKIYPNFAQENFVAEIAPQLKKHELKGRVKLISTKLRDHLPKDIDTSLSIFIRAVKSEKNPTGVHGFLAWPFTQYIEDFCLENFDSSMEAMKEITQTMSAEFAIRPFLIKYPEKSLSILKKWSKSNNFHVRRLVSEGTRPRLPWGQRLSLFQKDPTICIELLRTLKNDPEIYVRKSVANHLNDISKDHPDFLVKELKSWLKEGNKEIEWIARHASRTLLKSGHKGALSLFGYSESQLQNIKFSLSTKKIKVGDSIEMKFSANTSQKSACLIDYRIHLVRANGKKSIKVFKWAKKNLLPSEKIQITKKHSFKKITTRRYYPGKHLIEVQVNGMLVAKANFDLL
jgi:3-methyladenine DNA glycosylase AlkC